MIISLPIVKKTFDEKTSQINVEKDTLNVSINSNYQAHLKWEEQFERTEGVDLTTMAAKVSELAKNPNDAIKHPTKFLKVLYCFIDTKELPTFKDFLGILEIENTKEVLDKVSQVLDEVYKTASKN